MEMTSITFLIDASSWGGIEQHVVTLVDSLKKNTNLQVNLIVWQRHADPQVYQRMESIIGGPIAFANGSYRQLSKLLKSQQVDCLHTHGYKANIIGRLIRLQTGVRVISTHHNGDVGTGKVRLYTLIDQLTCALVENWVVSSAIKKRLSPVKTQLIRNFISSDPVKKPEKRGALFVGRMVTVKRPDRFLRLAEATPNYSFHLVGDGPLAGQVQAKKPSNTRWHGYQSSAEKIWAHGDIYVLCSDDEGLPLTALEAMARGIPVIATAVGELPMLINHGENGWIADTEEEQITALEKWSSMSVKQRNQMANAAIKTFQDRYSVEACLPEYLALYNSPQSLMSHN